MKVYIVKFIPVLKNLAGQRSGNQSRHLNTLAGFVCEIIQSRQVKLAAVAEELPNAGKEESRVMQFRRLLSNSAGDYNVYFMPMIALITCPVLAIRPLLDYFS